MIGIICVGIKRDSKNRIIGYYLMGKTKVKKYIDKNKLKELIKSGYLKVDNLTLTSDGRLVIKKKLVSAEEITAKEVPPKKSLRETVREHGYMGYTFKGLYYFMQNGKVVVNAQHKKIKGAKIINGTFSIDADAFSGCKDLESIIIPDSVTSIGNSAFKYCTSLTTIIIPDSVTNIGKQAFDNCVSLTTITIPNSVTSIGGDAFCGCKNLIDITIPDSVTSIEAYTFSGCTCLTNITIPDSVTSIDDFAFYACKGLTHITIPDGVTSIGDGVFCDCKNLTDIIIPNSVTSIGEYAFYNCDKVNYVKIPKRFKERIWRIHLSAEDVKYDFY